MTEKEQRVYKSSKVYSLGSELPDSEMETLKRELHQHALLISQEYLVNRGGDKVTMIPAEVVEEECLKAVEDAIRECEPSQSLGDLVRQKVSDRLKTEYMKRIGTRRPMEWFEPGHKNHDELMVLLDKIATIPQKDQLLAELVGKLTEVQRQIFQMFLQDKEVRYAQIVQETGKSLGTVSKDVRRIRQAIASVANAHPEWGITND